MYGGGLFRTLFCVVFVLNGLPTEASPRGELHEQMARLALSENAPGPQAPAAPSSDKDPNPIQVKPSGEEVFRPATKDEIAKLYASVDPSEGDDKTTPAERQGQIKKWRDILLEQRKANARLFLEVSMLLCKLDMLNDNIVMLEKKPVDEKKLVGDKRPVGGKKPVEDRKPVDDREWWNKQTRSIFQKRW